MSVINIWRNQNICIKLSNAGKPFLQNKNNLFLILFYCKPKKLESLPLHLVQKANSLRLKESSFDEAFKTVENIDETTLKMDLRNW